MCTSYQCTREKRAGLGSADALGRFATRCASLRDDLLRTVHTLLKSTDDGTRERRAVCYGASGRACTISSFCGLARPLVDAVIDDAPAKLGAFTPGNHLPIVASSVLYTDDKPDIVLLLAWAFAKAIIKKHVKFVEDGGIFIIPLPVVCQVDKSNLANFLSSEVMGL